MSEEEINNIFSSDLDYLTNSFDLESKSYVVSNTLGVPIYEKPTIVETADNTSDVLQGSLKECTHLDNDTKARYMYIAGVYTKDIADNLFRNQFDLHRVYRDITIDEWNDFLSDRIVSTYTTRHKRTLLKSTAEDNLADPNAKNKRDNLKLIENLETQEQRENNKNICIIRIPDIYNTTD